MAIDGRHPTAHTAPRLATTLLTDRDLAIARWVSRHRFVNADQVRRRFALGRTVAYRRLGALVHCGLLEHRWVFAAEPGVYLATRAGIGVAGVELPPPSIDIRTFRHDAGAVDLVVEAERGGATVTTEREARHTDAWSSGGRFSVDMTGGRHFPDLIVEAAEDGGRVAVELELTPKRLRRLRQILEAYEWATHFDRVVYHVRSERWAERVRDEGRRLYLSKLHVFEWRPR